MFYIICKKLDGTGLAYWTGNKFTFSFAEAKAYESRGHANPKKGRDHSNTAFDDCRKIVKTEPRWPAGYNHPIVINDKWLFRRRKEGKDAKA